MNVCGESASPTNFSICARPNPPQNLSVFIRADGSAEISWDKDYKADSYNIYYQQGNQTVKANVKESPFIDTNFSQSKDNFYVVTTVSVCGGESERWAGKIGCLNIRAPYITSIEAVSQNSVKITWANMIITGEPFYDVYRATSENGNYSRITTVKRRYQRTAYIITPSYTDVDLSPSTIYYCYLTY